MKATTHCLACGCNTITSSDTHCRRCGAALEQVTTMYPMPLKRAMEEMERKGTKKATVNGCTIREW